MKKLAVEFLEEYKKTDRACAERLSVQAGLTEYITRMTDSADGARLIPGWQDELRMLKHLRWLRNRLAHEVEEVKELEQKDLRDLKDFASRLQQKKDPLSLLAAAKSGKKKPRAAKKKRSAALPVILIALALLAAAAIWYFTR